MEVSLSFLLLNNSRLLQEVVIDMATNWVSWIFRHHYPWIFWTFHLYLWSRSWYPYTSQILKNCHFCLFVHFQMIPEYHWTAGGHLWLFQYHLAGLHLSPITLYLVGDCNFLLSSPLQCTSWSPCWPLSCHSQTPLNTSPPIIAQDITPDLPDMTMQVSFPFLLIDL